MGQMWYAAFPCVNAFVACLLDSAAGVVEEDDS